MELERELDILRVELMTTSHAVRRLEARLSDREDRVRAAEGEVAASQRREADLRQMLARQEQSFQTERTEQARVLAEARDQLQVALTRLAVLEAGRPQGYAVELPADGRTPSGDAPSGDAPSGDAPSGDAPSGDAPSGDAPSGDAPSGDAPSGDAPSGDAPSGGMPSGDAPSGDAPSGRAARHGRRKKYPHVKPSVPAKPKEPRRKRAPHHNTWQRTRTATATQTHHLDTCPTCHVPLRWPQVVRRVLISDLPEASSRVVVTEHVLIAGTCPRCRRRHTPRLDDPAIRVGRRGYGPRFVAYVAYLDQQMRLPIGLIQEHLATINGCRISAGGIVDLLHAAATALQPARAAILTEVRQAPVLYADETSLRQNGRNGWLWMIRTIRAVYYHFALSRAAIVAATLIGPWYTGCVCSDFYAAYNGTTHDHQRCWAHFLRDLDDLVADHADDLDVLHWCWAVRWLYVWAVGVRGQGAAAYDECVGLARTLGEQYATTAGHPCRRLAQRLLRFLHQLFVFVRNGAVEPTNNRAEQAMRPIAVQRKISGGTRSDRGSETLATLATLFATWRARGEHTLHACVAELRTPRAQAALRPPTAAAPAVTPAAA